MNDRTLRYWPKHKPIPKGWVKCGELNNHHGEYAILIEEKVNA